MKGSISWLAGAAVFSAFSGFTVWLFYLGGFRLVLSNQSSSLPVEAARAQSRVHREAAIVVLGNSTAAEDFHVEWFNRHADGARALNLGIPSGHVYLFERMLDLAVREGVRPRKIILTTTPEILSLRPGFDFLLNDLTLLKTVMAGDDIIRLRSHTQNPVSYVDYASRVVMRPVLYRSELRDFLEHPLGRFEDAAKVRKYLASIDGNTPAYESKSSFSLCGIGPLKNLKEKIQQLEATHDPAASDYAKVQESYAVRAGQPLAVNAFETQRFRHLLRTLTAIAPVYVIGAPVYDPDFEQYPALYRASAEETIRKEASGVTGVVILPDFQADCSMFADTVHLNRNGGEHFTEYLRARVL